MARFFFHVRQGDDVEPDLTGLDLPDAKVARSAAFNVIHGLRDEIAVEGFTDWTLELTDEAGAVILRLFVGDLPPRPSST